MNYQKIYNSLIEKRLKEPASGYTERHHIVPKSLGGSNNPSNLVVLTGREHWVAHLLLHKIHRLPQTAHACHMMACGSKRRGIDKIKSSRMYQSIREECALNVSKVISSIPREKLWMYDTMWICNVNLKKSMRIKKWSKIPEGWIKGREKWTSRKKKTKNMTSRILLPRQITIRNKNNHFETRRLRYEDQLPIPRGWELGGRPHTKNSIEAAKKYWGGKPRPYRRGLKHNKRK